ncbi:MAG: glycerol-3-phosphate dehydrogenase subunit GlpB [Haloferacaceae archaeon]
MALGADVLVVGGGLAGLTAALAAARTGADVRLVSHRRSTLRSASGLVDVLGYAPDGSLVADPFARLDDLPAGHPYERAGADAVREGLALFDDVTDYRGGHTDRNALVPTHGGTVKPTARYPPGAAAGLASDGRDALFVGFETLLDLDAPAAADHLAAAGVPFAPTGATVDFPADIAADAEPTRYARLLDESVDGGDDRVAALAERVRPHLDGAERVGFPAVLGDERHDAVRRRLSDALGADAFEVPMGPPSLPGLRLESQLFDALDRAGAGVETGNPVVGYEADGDRVEALAVERAHTEVPVHCEQVVLATGGLVGRGVETDRDGAREPLFGLYVPHPADRYDWFADDPFGDHAFARFGLDVDRELRPRDADGSVAFANLRAAGGVLGGADAAAEKSGGGTALATGYAAGRAAGEAV